MLDSPSKTPAGVSHLSDLPVQDVVSKAIFQGFSFA